MCEIQFIMSNKPVVAKYMRRLLNCGYKNGHNDAVGVLCYNGSDWSHAKTSDDPTKLMASPISIAMKQARVIIGHNRFTTKGSEKNNENNHPFVIDDWALVHNGVLDCVDMEKVDELREKYGDIETDSYEFFMVFKDYYDTTQNVKVAIENALRHFSGNFSIFLTNMKTNIGYYFKCDAKRFYFKANVKGNTWRLIGSTNGSNIDNVFTSTEHKGLFKRTRGGEEYDFTPMGFTLYEINYNSKTFEDAITNAGNIDYDEPDEYFDSANFEHFFPSTWFALKQLGLTIDDVDVYGDGTFGIYCYGLAADKRTELLKTMESERIVINYISEYFIEFSALDYYEDIDEWR